MTNLPGNHSEHPRIKNRTPELQEYRDSLAHTLREKRASGQSEEAYKLLEQNRSTLNYILAKYGYTQEGADKLIEAQRGRVVVGNLEKFKGVDHKEVAFKLIEAGVGFLVVVSLEKFKGVDHNEIVSKLFENGGLRYVACHLKKFKNLDPSIAEYLRKIGYGKRVDDNSQSFKK